MNERWPSVSVSFINYVCNVAFIRKNVRIIKGWGLRNLMLKKKKTITLCLSSSNSCCREALQRHLSRGLLNDYTMPISFSFSSWTWRRFAGSLPFIFHSSTQCPEDCILPRSICSSEEQDVAVRASNPSLRQRVSLGLISPLAKSPVFVFVSLDQDLSGDSKGWKKGMWRSKRWTPLPKSSTLKTLRANWLELAGRSPLRASFLKLQRYCIELSAMTSFHFGK